MRVPWVHHGRDAATGLDCVGLVLAVYERVGLSLADMDVPYAEGDCRRRGALLLRILDKRFKRIDAGGRFGPLDCESGDVLVLRSGTLFHVAIVVDGVVLEMAQKWPGSRNLRANGLNHKIWPFVDGVYRHRELL